MANEMKNIGKEFEKADITTLIPATARLLRQTARQPYSFTREPLMKPGT